MEIDITRFFETAETHDFSASVAEMGANAGKITGANANREASESPLLTTEDQLDAMRQFARDAGFSEDMAKWSPAEVNALFIQWVSGDINEMHADWLTDDNGETDWEKVEAAQTEGRIASNIYRGDNGKVYFYLGS